MTRPPADNLRRRVSEELLPFVRQPGQYIGGEINQVVRDWDAAAVRVALAFPETYAIGMSHLGCAILYAIANGLDGVACERVFAPWLDAERVMRAKHLPLFTWESRRPVASADLVAFSLQYEMTFTNVLNMLDLAGVPIRAADRNESHPLVVAGGPQADNPEPLADFVDLFVIGDGEGSFPELIADVGELKGGGATRAELLAEIARRHEWAYVPSLYEVAYHADGTIAAFGRKATPSPEADSWHGPFSPAPATWHGRLAHDSEAHSGPENPGQDARATTRVLIRRCRTPDFESAPFPTAQIIPWTKAVHERITVEIMRGCPQRCRFCHAGHTKHPLVWRSVDRIVQLAEETYRATGLEEVALTSLSTSDYPRLGELMGRMNDAFAPRHVSLSVPSLRVDKQLQHIPWQVRQVRKSGLTIAAEAAREHLRQVIGKKVADVDLLEGVRAAYRAGWRSVKLYFMVGLPGETEDDVRAIVELARQVAAERKAVSGQPASVTAAVSPLVPKPHTPFQWVGQRDGEYFTWARGLLKSLAYRTPVNVTFHKIERSLIEAVFARGDRRVGRALEIAWRNGARFDGWDECFDFGRWVDAFKQAGLDPAFYAQRERPFDEILPWDHIESGAGRAWLQHQAELAREQLKAAGPPAGDTRRGPTL